MNKEFDGIVVYTAGGQTGTPLSSTSMTGLSLT